jgi:hypothetical protein
MDIVSNSLPHPALNLCKRQTLQRARRDPNGSAKALDGLERFIEIERFNEVLLGAQSVGILRIIGIGRDECRLGG